MTVEIKHSLHFVTIVDETHPVGMQLLKVPELMRTQMLEEMLKELLMRAKVQFINGDLTGATETYRNIETRYSDNYEAKVMLKRISKIRQEESYLGYLKTRQEMLEEIERDIEKQEQFIKD